jgi:hypothetical protein
MGFWDNLDQAQAEESSRGLDPGQYNVYVSNIKVKETRLEVGVTIEFTTTENQKVWWYFQLDDKSSPKRLSFIKAQILKLSGKETTGGNPLQTLQECLHKDARIEIAHTQHNGKSYQNIYIRDNKHSGKTDTAASKKSKEDDNNFPF